MNTTLIAAQEASLNQSSYVKPDTSSDELLNEDTAFKVAKIIIYVCILVVSTTGNSLVIAVIYRSPRMRAKPRNLLILNLALCDLFLPLISIPFDLVIQETSYRWPFGLTMCKLLGPLATIAVTSSSLTLACIALDRYRALLHPFKTKLSLRHMKFMIASLHVLSVLVVVPYIVHLDIKDGETCEEHWPAFAYRQAYTLVLVLIQYVLPLLFMLWMYVLAASKLYRSSSTLRGILIPGKQDHNITPNLRQSFVVRRGTNRKVTKMFSIIVIIFVLCTLPNQVFWLWSDFAEGYKYKEAFYVAIVCHWFTYANSCLNPLVFFTFSKDFNDGFRKIIRKLLCKNENDIQRLHRIWREFLPIENNQKNMGISTKSDK